MEIIPGIFEPTTAEREQKLALVAPYVEWVHMDIADSTFVPHTALPDIALFKSLVSDFSKLSMEAHLLVADPEKYIKPLADAGFKRLIAQVEANDPRRFLDEAKYESVEVGMGIDGPTELEQGEPLLELVDFVHIMTIEVGGNGIFLPETVEKIKAIHHHFPDLPIVVEGAMDEKIVGIVKDAGASRIVVTDFLFADPANVREAIGRLTKV